MNVRIRTDQAQRRRIVQAAHFRATLRPSPRIRAAAALLALLAVLLLSQAALAAEVARFEGEDMAHGAFADEPANPSAENGVTLRYESNGTATRGVELVNAASEVVVRSRNAPASDGSVTINLVVDGVAQSPKTIDSSATGKTYAMRRWTVALSAGSHTIGVRGGGLAGSDRLLVDYVALNGSDAAPAPPCDKYASPSGSDSNAGTEERPYGTVDTLGESLAAGQVGCVRGGIYDQDPSIRNGGVAGTPITIKSYPGETAELRGNLVVNGNYTVVEGMTLKGHYGDPKTGTGYDAGETKTTPALTVQGDNVTVQNLDVTNRDPQDGFDRSGQAILVSGDANGFRLLESRVHHWGEPNGGNNHQHGLYQQGDNFEVRDNVFYDNTGGGDRALQLYPDADNGLVEGNIVAHSNDVGCHFSADLRGSNTSVSTNNTCSGNVITHTREDWNIDALVQGTDAGDRMPTDAATRNEAVDNCVWVGEGQGSNATNGGVEPKITSDKDYFYAANNVLADPEYFDPANNDYRIKAGTLCAAKFTGPTSNLYTP